MAVRRFEGSAASLADVMDELRMLPFFSKRRIVLVEDADPFVTKNRKELEAHVECARRGRRARPDGEDLAGNHQALSPGRGGRSAAGLQQPHREGAAYRGSFIRPRSRAPSSTRTRHGCWWSWSGPRSACSPPRSRSWPSTSGRAAGSAGPTSLGWSRPAGSRPSGRCIDAATTGKAGRGRSPTSTTCWPPASIRSSSWPPWPPSLLKVHHAGRLRAVRIDLAEACQIAGIRDFAVDKTRRQHAHLGPSRVDQLPAWLLKADLDLKGEFPPRPARGPRGSAHPPGHSPHGLMNGPSRWSHGRMLLSG